MYLHSRGKISRSCGQKTSKQQFERMTVSKKAPLLHFWIKASFQKMYQHRFTRRSQGFHTSIICFIIKAHAKGHRCRRSNFSCSSFNGSVSAAPQIFPLLPQRCHSYRGNACMCMSLQVHVRERVCVCGPPSIQSCPPVCSVSDIWPETRRP